MAPKEHTENDGTRRARLALSAMVVTLVSLAINILGATAFWWALPTKLAETKETLVDHESRLRVLEADRGLLQRIDERTKSIQDDVKQLHQDFSFRASGSPSK